MTHWKHYELNHLDGYVTMDELLFRSMAEDCYWKAVTHVEMKMGTTEHDKEEFRMFLDEIAPVSVKLIQGGFDFKKLEHWMTQYAKRCERLSAEMDLVTLTEDREEIMKRWNRSAALLDVAEAIRKALLYLEVKWSHCWDERELDKIV